ncbi:MAG: NAD(P)/FAD-dependent oxidoreductase [Candidatus Acidiferrales bacterium]
MDRANVLVIGGGVVGCAVARELAAQWKDVFLVESAPRLGAGASTRNSGVIHSGIYYPPGSLKARLCVRGNRLTHDFCAAHGVAHRACGKLVVASSESEMPALEALCETGQTNGVKGLRLVDRARIRALEPNIEAVAALEVPSTGILNSEELLKAYARHATERGASLVTRARVTALEPGAKAIRAHVAIGEPGSLEEETIEARCVINCAGLFADEVAAMVGNTRYRIYPVRGEYCEVVREKADLVRALVYPVPHQAGVTLGVHLTKTTWGALWVGPTADYIDDKNDYERDRKPVEDFARAAKPMLPEITAHDLRLAHTGIRAKLLPPGDPAVADFVIAPDPAVPRMIQLIGIESPGLTSALAIAEHVAALAAKIF